MKIVYTSWSGALAAVAAALHLRQLSRAGPREIMAAPYFAGLGRYDRGFLFSCGRDSSGNEVLIAGHGDQSGLVVRAIEAAARLAGQDDREWRFIDCQPVAGISGAIAESAWQMLCGPGRGAPLLARIIARWYSGLAELAGRIRDQYAR